MKTKMPFLTSALLILLTTGALHATPYTMSALPDSGQTARYSTLYGEDSCYTINPPTYKNNADGTVTDKVTGLMWQQAESTLMTWENALVYAESLSLASHTDWRVPNIKELQSVSDIDYRAPSMNKTYFPGATATRYWSSTTLVDDPTSAWYLDSDYGLTTYTAKIGSWHVRCVRGGTTTSLNVPSLEPIPAGSFIMGDHFNFTDPDHPSDELPLHSVTIDAFCMGTYDVTNLQYCTYLNSALAQGLIEVRSGLVYAVSGTTIYCETRSGESALFGTVYSGIEWSGSSFSVLSGRDNHPMVGVRWAGAASYCNWLSATQGYQSCYNLSTWVCDFTKYGYRLPTEAEWEYAANGGNTNPYYQFPWGSNTNSDGSWANWESSGDPYESGDYPWTTPVGFYDGTLHLKADFNWPGSQTSYQTSNAVNGFGLYDMGGNVWQWVNDWYSSGYYSISPSINPTGPSGGDLMPDGLAYHGMRGGEWFNGGQYLGLSRISNRDPGYYRGPQDPNHPYYHVGFRVALKTTSLVQPVISTPTLSPAIPTATDTVWVTGTVTDDTSVATVRLTYSTGIGTSSTSTIFTETMYSGTAGIKPWTGSGTVNAWTVTGNYLEQRTGANYGTGNACGLEYKGGSTLNTASSAMMATTSSINASGTSGYVEFYIQTMALDGSDGWTFQLDSGSGFVTRLSELSGTSHTWQKYHYDLASSELISTLKMRFQFAGGGTGDDDRIDLDQISVTVVSVGSSGTTVTMYDDGAHGDGAAGDNVYGALIPAMPVGTTVNYYLTATDGTGLSTHSPATAPTTQYSYVVQAANTSPVISSVGSTSGSASTLDPVWVTTHVTDNGSVASVKLIYNVGSGAVSVTMFDDGLHGDSAAGDGIYGGSIPAFPAGTSVSYYITATDNLGLVTTGTTNYYTVQKAFTNQTMGLYFNTESAYNGYTLIAPMHYTYTYLIDNAGEVVHRWKSAYEPGRSAYLLENGHMIRACMIMNGGISTGGGEGGRIEEYDWDGNMVWAFDYYSSTYMAHHDFKVLPNGNVLILAVEKKTYAEVIAAGFNPSLLDSSIATQGYMLPDYLIEVTPTFPYGGTIVWEWHMWDHMIQDYDSTKNNYGVVADHPERINPNGTGIMIPQFWTHVNGIDYNASLDQVMLSIRNNSEVFIIDHQITTAQAASHAGGRYSKGGDILYRWGNPQQYNRGTSANRMLYQEHHTHWIPSGLPGAGDILIYNNGIGRGYSTINEITPPVDTSGSYTLISGSAYGPSTCAWSYTGNPATDFYSAEISGCQRLPNGNTLICEGVKGNLFEVTTSGQTVWRYVCPVTDTGPLTQYDAIPGDGVRDDQYMNAVFRVYRYAPGYVGLLGRDLTPQGTVELSLDQTLRITGVAKASDSSELSISWVSLPELDYSVLYSPSLQSNSWTTIATFRSIGSLATYTDTDPIRLSLARGFYRIKLTY